MKVLFFSCILLIFILVCRDYYILYSLQTIKTELNDERIQNAINSTKNEIEKNKDTYDTEKKIYMKLNKLKKTIEKSDSNITFMQKILNNFAFFNNIPLLFFIVVSVITYFLYNKQGTIKLYSDMVKSFGDTNSKFNEYDNIPTDFVITGNLSTDFTYFVKKPLVEFFITPSTFTEILPPNYAKFIKEHTYNNFFRYLILGFLLIYIFLPRLYANVISLIALAIFLNNHRSKLPNLDMKQQSFWIIPLFFATYIISDFVYINLQERYKKFKENLISRASIFVS